MVAVTVVEGLNDAATTAIAGAKLTVGTVTQQSSNTVATGNVISQDPASGSSAAEGSPVTLVISSGPPMVAVPNVAGLTSDAGRAGIAGTSRRPRHDYQQNCNTGVNGDVISQDRRW